MVGLQLLAHAVQYGDHEHIDASEQVILRDAILQPELIEQNSPGRQSAAPSSLPSKEVVPRISGITIRRRSQAFFDSIDPTRTSAGLKFRSTVVSWRSSYAIV